MPKNIFSNIPDSLPKEVFETLFNKPGITIERIISKGQHTPEHEWYDQDRDEWVLLLTGHATLRFADHQTTTLRPGDYLFIPAHTRHQVSHTADDVESIWLAIHFD